jgi:hypothetical protein
MGCLARRKLQKSSNTNFPESVKSVSIIILSIPEVGFTASKLRMFWTNRHTRTYMTTLREHLNLNWNVFYNINKWR